jgi:hypothetical protein
VDYGPPPGYGAPAYGYYFYGGNINDYYGAIQPGDYYAAISHGYGYGFGF